MSYEDIPEVARLERSAFSQPWSESGIRTYYDSGSTLFIVAKHKGHVIGYGAVMRVIDEGNLISLIVDEDYRRMKIAKEILDILYDLSAKNGVLNIFLEVRSSNEAAIALYEGDGFEQIGIRRGFYDRPKEDALLYKKEL